MARTYRLKRRAEQQEATRRRIVEATVALHERQGAAKTSIRAIAELAGVERMTVYRHFPDERSLFAACTQHYLTANPPPDPQPWCTIADPERRLRTALQEIYSYYRRNERMFTHSEHDLADLPALREVLAPNFAHWARVRAALAEGWPAQISPDLLGAAIAHAVAFFTWKSLVREQGLSDAAAVEVMVGMVRCLSS